MASSISLLTLKLSFEKTNLFLWCHTHHVREIHQMSHRCELIPGKLLQNECWRKCCLGFCGNTPTMLIQDKDSHQSGIILWQLKNRWAASSSLSQQNGHNLSMMSTFLLHKLDLVGNLSRNNLQAKNAALLGIFSFHTSWNTSSIFSSLDSLSSSWYALLIVYTPVESLSHTHLSCCCSFVLRC